MAEVDTLFREYMDEHRAGGSADLAGYLARVEGTDRRELEALIDGYLARGPGKAWDARAFDGSPAQRATAAIAASWDDWDPVPPASGWQELLPALRSKAQIKRAELVGRLANVVGAAGQESKVAAYYHQMETGRLPSEGVSDRVLQALADILGESAERLRATGSAITAGADATEVSTKLAFARVAIRDPDQAGDAERIPDGAASQASPPEAGREELDRVDELFTGGPGAG